MTGAKAISCAMAPYAGHVTSSTPPPKRPFVDTSPQLRPQASTSHPPQAPDKPTGRDSHSTRVPERNYGLAFRKTARVRPRRDSYALDIVEAWLGEPSSPVEPVYRPPPPRGPSPAESPSWAVLGALAGMSCSRRSQAVGGSLAGSR